MFRLSGDPERKLIIAQLGGFLSPSEVESFFSEEQELAQDLGFETGYFDLLVETEGSVIQSQDVVSGFLEQIATVALRARRVAVVREGAMSTLQTRRILSGRSEAAIFSDRETALQWLLDR